ncbi:uncharacterized protein Dwil_GK28190 [Drosophila willistoni]|uniref:Uncharacterized protein n=1 Tax=Drosophila willistoni TaxID=7260 RepID=A0A0Q9WR66_DROWI|nr:uncharacterized protein Dwil_GK28190 [Drosophila willistoni]
MSLKYSFLVGGILAAFHVVHVNVAVLKRFNGYKPFLYNTTIDGCKCLASQKKNILHNFFYSFISQVSNLNHSCPYDHDIILDKLTIEFLNYQLVDVLPAPEGDYAVFTNWYSSGNSRAEIQVYGTLS